MPRRALIVGSIAVSTLLSPHKAFAQTTPPDEHAPTNTMLGLSVGVPGYGSHAASELLVLGFNVLKAQPSMLGMELSLGTAPKLLSEQAIVFGGRLNGVLPLAVTPNFWVLPSAGGSMVGGASSDGGGAFVGLNAGVGAIAWTGQVGLRANVTWHHFADMRGAFWLVEFGFVGGR